MHRLYRTFALAGLLGALLLALPQQAHAGGIDLTDKLEKHVRETVEAVHATDDAAEKREILNDSFEALDRALLQMQRLPRLSDANHQTIDALLGDVRAHHNRLNGANGMQPVPDANLNQFASSAQQSFDLQNRTITLSLTTALLILIILILVL